MSIFASTEDNPIRQQFDSFDKDGSGFLEGPEAIAALATLGSNIKLEDIDTDGDGAISFDEFNVFFYLGDKHSHPIFKKAVEVGTSTGISVFAGEAHKNQAFMQTAAKAWRKLGATSNFSEKDLKRVYGKIDIDNDGYLDPGEVRLAIKNIAPQITEMEITLMLASTCRTLALPSRDRPIAQRPPHPAGCDGPTARTHARAHARATLCACSLRP